MIIIIIIIIIIIMIVIIIIMGAFKLRNSSIVYEHKPKDAQSQGPFKINNTSQKASKWVVPLFLFLPHFDVNCDLLVNRRTETWNLFVEQSANSGRPGTGVTLGLAVLI